MKAQSPSPGATLRVLSPPPPQCWPEERASSTGDTGPRASATAPARPEDAAEKAVARAAREWSVHGAVHLLADSEVTRKSCLVFLGFLRMSLKHMNPFSDLSVMRPAKPRFLLPPRPPADGYPHTAGGIL